MTGAESQGGGRFLRGHPPVRRPGRRTWLLLGAAALMLLVLPPLLGENGLAAYWRLRRERNDLGKRVEALRRQDADLDRRIEQLGSDAALERLAREEYGMIRPGERVYEVIEDPPRQQER
jgi:cell division protein FtsB